MSIFTFHFTESGKGIPLGNYFLHENDVSFLQISKQFSWGKYLMHRNK